MYIHVIVYTYTSIMLKVGIYLSREINAYVHMTCYVYIFNNQYIIMII